MTEIRAYNKSLALCGSGSKDIYADICVLFMVVMKCSHCGWLCKFSAGVESVKMHLSLVDLSLQVIQGLLKSQTNGKI